MSNPPAIYWQEKANVCQRAFILQLQLGQEKEAIRNLFRYTHALNMARYEQALEKEKK